MLTPLFLITNIIVGAEKNMIATLKRELKQHPVVSMLVIGFVMAGVEKMLEEEFVCPCYSSLGNAFIVVPFFMIPAFTAVGLMVLIHGWHGCHAKTLFNFLPALLWVALLLLDGRYVVCAATNWSGTFASPKDTDLKWCQPSISYHQASLMDNSRWIHIQSQVAGIVFFFLLLLVFIKYVVNTRSSGQPENDEEPGQKKTPEEPDNPETLHLQEV